MPTTYPQGRRSACHAKALGTPIDKRLKEKKRDLARRMCFAMSKQHHMCWVPPRIRFLMSLRALQPKPSCGGWSRHSNHSQRGALVSKSDTFLDKMCRWFINSFTCGVPAERRAGRVIWKHCIHHISAGPPQCVPCQGAGHAHRQLEATHGEKARSRKANVLRHVQTAPHVLDIPQHPFPDVSQSRPAEI